LCFQWISLHSVSNGYVFTFSLTYLTNTTYLSTFLILHMQGNYSETSIYRSRIYRSISMVPERILFQLWLPHLSFSRIHCFFFRPLTKTMNRGFTVITWILSANVLLLLIFLILMM
jgi:hypothetical protein